MPASKSRIPKTKKTINTIGNTRIEMRRSHYRLYHVIIENPKKTRCHLSNSKTNKIGSFLGNKNYNSFRIPGRIVHKQNCQVAWSS